MRFPKVSSAIVLASMAGATAYGQTIVENVDVRANGVFGVDLAGAAVINNAAPASATFTLTGLDIDGDGVENDDVTVTLNSTGALVNQGGQVSFGSVDGLTVTATASGTTSEGAEIAFDGFTGATLGAGIGSGNGLTNSANINGQLATVTFAADPDGGFNFSTDAIDFAVTDSVVFEDVARTGGSRVARAFDLQFSAVPEPASLALLGLGGLAVLGRRRG